MLKSWKTLWWAGGSLFLLLFLLTSWPAEPESIEVRLTSPENESIQVAGKAAIEVPRNLWQGEGGSVRLVITADEQVWPGSGGVMLETRLEMPAKFASGETKWEALVPGRPATFTWGVRGSAPGPVQGTVWVWANAGAERVALLARPVEFTVRTVGGFQPVFVRWSAALLALVCLLAGFIPHKTLE